jgi:hypothetical protein
MTGTIILWYGSIVGIPAGWKHCNGTNGTPDLRNYVPVCAGSTYAVGAAGGAVNHLHAFTAVAHQHTIQAGANISNAAPARQPNTDGVVVTGNTNNTNGLPPYKSLAYIQYTGF